jgi:predicted permease
MKKLTRRILYWLESRRHADDLAEEMEFHRAMLARDGAPQAALGNTTLARENARAVWIWPWLEGLWQDAAYGLRAMRREPAFTFTALAALACAIGVNTGLFTVFNAFALQAWTVRDPASVVTIHRFTRDGAGGFGIAEYRYLTQHSRSLEGLIAMSNGEEVKLGDRPLQLTYVSGNYFRVLGIGLERGRGFLDEEDNPGDPQAVVVLSHDTWQNRFGGDPQIVGRSIRLDDVPFTVVGVAPEDFHGTNPLRNEVWAPLPAKLLLRPSDPASLAWLTNPDFCCTPIAGRLAPGVTRATAEAEVSVLLHQFLVETRVVREPFRIVMAGTSWLDSPRKKKQVIPTLSVLFLAVTLVLLLACANVGNLLVARAAARRREIAVRLSLGGSRIRLIRQLLVESLLLALAAAAIAFPLGFVASKALIRQLAGPAWYPLTPDLHVLAYTLAIAVLSCLAFGLAPALHGTSGGIATALKADAQLSRVRLPLRSILLGVQVAISVVLLAGAGILVRGLSRAQNIDPGFDVRNVTVLSVELPAKLYTGPRTQALTANLEAQLDRSPGLPPSALAQTAPLGNSTYSTNFQLLTPNRSPMMQIWATQVSPAYFDVLRIPFVEGHNLTADDTPACLVVNESAAKRWWPGESAIGKSVFAYRKVRQIVGVVADSYTHDLHTSDEPMLYLPITGAQGAPVILVHERNTAAVDRVSAMVKQLEPRAQIHAEPLSANFDRQMEPNRIGAALAGFLGLLALGIASVGMAGVFAYVVGRRTREIGVRMALGAQSAQIVRLVLGSTLQPLVCGLAVGLVFAVAISMLLAGLLPGVKPTDPLAYINVVLLLGIAVALASAVPARRATKVDPVKALRCD